MRGKRTQRMRACFIGGGFAALFFFAGAAQAQNRNNVLSLGQLSESLKDLSSRISPSVVQVVGTGFGFDNDNEHAEVNVPGRIVAADAVLAQRLDL